MSLSLLQEREKGVKIQHFLTAPRTEAVGISIIRTLVPLTAIRDGIFSNFGKLSIYFPSRLKRDSGFIPLLQNILPGVTLLIINDKKC